MKSNFGPLKCIDPILNQGFLWKHVTKKDGILGGSIHIFVGELTIFKWLNHSFGRVESTFRDDL